MLIACVLSFLITLFMCIIWFTTSVRGGTATRGECAVCFSCTILSLVPLLGIFIALFGVLMVIDRLFEQNKDQIYSWFYTPVLKKKDVQSSD